METEEEWGRGEGGAGRIVEKKLGLNLPPKPQPVIGTKEVGLALAISGEQERDVLINLSHIMPQAGNARVCTAC